MRDQNRSVPRRRPQAMPAVLLAILVMIAAAVSSPVSALPATGSGPAQTKQESPYLFADSARTVQCSLRPPEGGTSGNEGDVHCDVVGTRTWTATPIPTACPTGWGNRIALDGLDAFPRIACQDTSVDNENLLAAGTVVDQSGFVCTILSPGVRCQQKDARYGFELSRERYTPLRPDGKKLLSPAGMGTLTLGMTSKKAQATGYFTPCLGPCGSPYLKEKWRGVTVWRHGRLQELHVCRGTNIATKRGVGPGASVSEAKQQYPGLTGPYPTTTLGYHSTTWVYLQRTKRGVLAFEVEFLRDRAPVDQDLVDTVHVWKKWSPSKGISVEAGHGRLRC